MAGDLLARNGGEPSELKVYPDLSTIYRAYIEKCRVLLKCYPVSQNRGAVARRWPVRLPLGPRVLLGGHSEESACDVARRVIYLEPPFGSPKFAFGLRRGGAMRSLASAVCFLSEVMLVFPLPSICTLAEGAESKLMKSVGRVFLVGASKFGAYRSG